MQNLTAAVRAAVKSQLDTVSTLTAGPRFFGPLKQILLVLSLGYDVVLEAEIVLPQGQFKRLRYTLAVSCRLVIPAQRLRLSALKHYAKDKQFHVAQLEAEVAMALTLPQAMKNGDVKAERNGKGQPKYVLSNCDNTTFHPNHVTLWRKVAEIPAKQRAEYYAKEQRPTRSGMLRWWDGQTVNSKPVVQSHGIVTDLGDLAGIFLPTSGAK